MIRIAEIKAHDLVSLDEEDCRGWHIVARKFERFIEIEPLGDAKGLTYIVENGDNTPDQWGYPKVRHYKPEVIERLKEAVKSLRVSFTYAQCVDWLLPDDDGEESFLKRLKEDLGWYEKKTAFPLTYKEMLAALESVEHAIQLGEVSNESEEAFLEWMAASNDAAAKVDAVLKKAREGM